MKDADWRVGIVAGKSAFDWPDTPGVERKVSPNLRALRNADRRKKRVFAAAVDPEEKKTHSEESVPRQDVAFGMARTSYISTRTIVRERYFWPLIQLNIWTIVILATGATILGIFADFISIQNELTLPQPWYVTTSALSD